MRQPGALSRTVLALIWLVLGVAMVAVAVWLGWTRWPAILNGHPAMLIAGIACGLLGFIAVAWSIGSLTIGDRQDREGDPDEEDHRPIVPRSRARRQGCGLTRGVRSPSADPLEPSLPQRACCELGAGGHGEPLEQAAQV